MASHYEAPITKTLSYRRQIISRRYLDVAAPVEGGQQAVVDSFWHRINRFPLGSRMYHLYHFNWNWNLGTQQDC